VGLAGIEMMEGRKHGPEAGQPAGHLRGVYQLGVIHNGVPRKAARSLERNYVRIVVAQTDGHVHAHLA
jgi:hypothetical protein